MLFHSSIVTPYRSLSTECGEDELDNYTFSNADGSFSSVWLELSPAISSHDNQKFGKNPMQASSVMTSTLWSSIPTNDATHAHSTALHSTLLFFLGATCQTIISIWNYRITTNGTFYYVYVNDDGASGLDSNLDNGNDDANTITEYNVYSFTDRLYYVLFTLGPALYVCSAMISIRESLASQGNSSRQAVSMNSGWFLAATTLFGVGALCQIYSTLLDDVYEQEDAWCDDTYLLQTAAERKWFASNYKMTTLSMHLYLLSGILHLIAQRHTCGFCGHHSSEPGPIDEMNMRHLSTRMLPSRLVFCGMLLFVVGAFMDCLISWIYDPQTLRGIYSIFPTLNPVVLAKVDVTSSILWNAGAVLYLLAHRMVYQCYDCSSKVRDGWHSTVTHTTTGTIVNSVGTSTPLSSSPPRLEEAAPLVDENCTTC